MCFRIFLKTQHEKIVILNIRLASLWRYVYHFNIVLKAVLQSIQKCTLNNIGCSQPKAHIIPQTCFCTSHKSFTLSHVNLCQSFYSTHYAVFGTLDAY